MKSQPAGTPGLTWLVGIIAAVCLIWFLRAAAVVVMPIAAAFFIAITVYPVLSYLQSRLTRFRWAALPLTMGLIVLLLGGSIWLLAEAIDEAAEAAPQYSGRLKDAWATVTRSANDYGVPVPTELFASPDMQERLGRLATSAVRGAWATVTGLILVIFLVLLMLLEAPVWNRVTRRVFSDDQAREMLETVGEIAAKVRQYLYVRTVMGLISTLVAGAWLLALQVDLVLVWMVLTFLLNYIPNIGSIIAAVPPALMALVQHGPMYGLMALGGLALFEQVIGNYLDPRMQGRRLRVSPVVVLVALVFWSWMWGAVGTLLAMPVTVTILVTASHVPRLSGIAALLAGDAEDAAERPRRRAAASRE